MKSRNDETLWKKKKKSIIEIFLTQPPVLVHDDLGTFKLMVRVRFTIKGSLINSPFDRPTEKAINSPQPKGWPISEHLRATNYATAEIYWARDGIERRASESWKSPNVNLMLRATRNCFSPQDRKNIGHHPRKGPNTNFMQGKWAEGKATANRYSFD